VIALFRRYAPELQFLALLLVAVGLSTSVVLMSMGSIGLFIVLAAYGNIGQRLSSAFRHPVVIGFFMLFLVHLIGLLWTKDFAFAFKDLRIKLPFLVFPLVFAAVPRLEEKRFQLLLWLLLLATFISTLISFGIYLRIFPSDKDLNDIRNISPFVSHIRLSLVIITALFAMIYLFRATKHGVKWILLPLACWFLYFIYLIESATGVLVLISAVVFTLIYIIIRTKNKWIRFSGIGLFTLVILFFTVLTRNIIHEFYTPKESRDHLDVYSKSGEKYFHGLENNMLENGYYTWNYIAINELRNTWNSRSTIPFDSTGKTGQIISQTLLRYMTSKGLRKDREGLLSLSDSDIQHVENGIANINYLKDKGLKRRLEQLIYEINSYYYFRNAAGSSLTQRLEFWIAGWSIFKANLWFGVGTGDPQLAFNAEYERRKSTLPEKNRLRSHNQFLSIGVAFGLFGLLVFIITLVIPFSIGWRENNLLFLVFYVGALVSFLNEDTLETQAGVTYFSFFLSLFLLAKPRQESTSSVEESKL
jgi:MFS family permease